jgi:hypothetical protein
MKQAMQDTPTRLETLTVQIAVALLIGLSVVGLVMNGVSWADFDRIWGNLGDRVVGPMHFRVILQPTMAAIKAARDGYKDAKAGKGTFVVDLFNEPSKRRANINEALLATSQIILLGLAMDIIYQVVFEESFYPFEAVLVAVLLAFVPYVLLRGVFGRAIGWWLGGHPTRPGK